MSAEPEISAKRLASPESGPGEFPAEVEMSLVEHLEELRRRVLRSLLAVVMAAAACLVAVKPLVRLLEVPAEGIRFLQLAPGEFLFVSFKVAGYAGLTLALPYVLYEGLGFVLPGLTRRERRLVAPAVSRFATETVPENTLVIHGEQDDIVPLAAVLDWARPQNLPLVVVPGGEHFFHGRLHLLAQIVTRWCA